MKYYFTSEEEKNIEPTNDFRWETANGLCADVGEILALFTRALLGFRQHWVEAVQSERWRANTPYSDMQFIDRV
jgi:hypothetical protein